MAFRKIFLFVNPDLAAPVPSDSPSTQLGLISKLPVYYFGETVIFCISLIDSQGNAVPYLTSDTFEMSVDNNFLHNDDLMAHTEGKADGTDSKVNVPGDWADVSAANGKLSVRVDFNTVSYETKIGGSEFIQVRTEIKKYDAGSENPAILMQALSTARNVVNGGEGEPEEADPNYLTAAQTRALAASEAGNKWKTGSGSPTYSSETDGDLYLDTSNSDVYQVVSGGYALVGNIEGQMPVLSAGSAVPVSAGAPPAVNVLPISGGYQLDFEIPAGDPGDPGDDGISPIVSVTQTSSGVKIYTSDAGGAASGEVLNGSFTVPILPYSSDSAYSALTCIAYNGGGYQVISATNAGETPDSDPSKFVCFASKGVDGVLSSASLVVSSLVSGAIVIPDSMPPPFCIKTDSGSIYPVEAGTVISSGGYWTIDPTPYYAYDGASAFSGTWTIYFAGGDKGEKGDTGETPTIIGGSVTTLPAGSSATVSVTSSGTTYTFDFAIPGGRDAHMIGESRLVSSLVSGALVVSNGTIPVALQTGFGSSGTIYPIEKGTITISGGAWVIDPAAYLAYDNSSAFAGPWTVFFAGGVSIENTSSLTSANLVSSAGAVTNANSVLNAGTVNLSSGVISQTYSGGESRVILTQSDYDALSVKDPAVWYYIRED